MVNEPDDKGGGVAWSVIVPSYNRPDQLRRCLAALQQLCQDEAIEIVVVDDGGERPAAPVAQSVPGGIEVRVIRQANQGPAAARNTGARAARGQWLAFTDDDCRPEPQWLSDLEAGLAANPKALVGGRTVNALPRNQWAEATQMLVDRVIAATDGGFLPTCNLAVRRDLFIESGGYDEDFPTAAGEDRAFCDGWRSRGGQIVLVENAVVRHEHHLTAVSFWRQHANYGAAARQVHRRPGGSAPWTLGSYVSLLSDPFRSRPIPSAVMMSARLLLSQMATGWGMLRTLLIRVPSRQKHTAA